ncbi:MAG: ABC transporter permease [Aphanocapsa lilacina HA4352-LM1]|jgi:ABC-2 type transport system permease protein/lipopolysaccharide transport system permease protein|nr:ABC transporter permease [Aphanocapsa lilacina HA4352-LM1]
MLRAIQPEKVYPSVQRYLELLFMLTWRNLKVRYRGSVLGIYWSLLNPLIMTGVYTAIFGTTFASYYNDSLLSYLLAAFTGLVVINFFNITTLQALPSVVASGAMLNKIRIPFSVLPLSLVGANIFQYVVGVLPLLVVMTLFITGQPAHVPLLLLPSLALALVATGISLMVSALYVFFRDLPYIYELVTFALFLSSPVFYPAAIVPDSVKPFLAINPLTPIIESLRQLILGGTAIDWGLLGFALLSGGVVCGLGWALFHAWSDRYMDLL